MKSCVALFRESRYITEFRFGIITIRIQWNLHRYVAMVIKPKLVLLIIKYKSTSIATSAALTPGCRAKVWIPYCGEPTMTPSCNPRRILHSPWWFGWRPCVGRGNLLVNSLIRLQKSCIYIYIYKSKELYITFIGITWRSHCWLTATRNSYFCPTTRSKCCTSRYTCWFVLYKQHKLRFNDHGDIPV